MADTSREIRLIEVDNLLNCTVDAAEIPVYNNRNSGNMYGRIERRMGITKMEWKDSRKREIGKGLLVETVELDEDESTDDNE